MDNVIRKLVFYLAIFGTLFHVYLVIHPYTPFAELHLSILDLTQVQRAAHVFLVALLGYLMSYLQLKNREFAGGLILALLTAMILVEFVKLDIPVALKVSAVVVWAITMLPPLIPPVQKFSNIACSVLCFLPFIYLVANYEKLIYRAIMPEPWDLLMAFSEMLLILGVIFRMSGPIMPIVVILFFLYNIFGNRVPGVFASPGFDLDMLLGKMYCETEAGIFGTITGVSLKYLIYFTTLGAVVTRLNFGKIIANIALLFVGRSPASPGRCSAVMAVLMGMFSGSGAADTQFVATLTKSLYEKVGYDKYVAAGVIATVGTIAYITPPVMGSISFLMVELLSIPYSLIIAMAIGPMLLYLAGIVIYNELYVQKEKLPQLEINTDIDFSYFRRYCYVFVPIVFIIILIYQGYSINITVTAATALFVIFAFLDHTIRPPLKNLFEALAEGITSLLPIASAVIAANMIMSMMVMSGLASKFSIILMNISGSSLLMATLFTGFFSLLLGMGVPPIATYVLTSALTAPTIQKMAMLNGIPEQVALLATHMFLFYYAVLAEVTPPVALSAYAAASVMGTDPIKTGIFAARVAIPKYLIGLTFILSFSGTAILVVPVLDTLPLNQALVMIISRFLFSFLAIFYLNAAVVGYFLRNLTAIERGIVGICAVLLFYPSDMLNMVVVLIPTVILAKIWIENRRLKISLNT
ncbi:MAG: TRAP transporter fused permease subunit [Deltaproteobacteria bacterium]|nr:TRAP transporter fused permease subunit [Deltaproteobacteria bacterium]